MFSITVVRNKSFLEICKKFKQFVHDLWFKLYRRDTRNDSSAFEHVFVGEERKGKLMGMHNWIRLYSEEKKGRMDYMGFIKPKVRQSGHPSSPRTQNESQIVTLQFSEQGELKTSFNLIYRSITGV